MSPPLVDFDVHGIVGVRLVDPPAKVVAELTSRMAHFRSPLERPAHVTVRFADQIDPPQLTYLGLNQAGYDKDHFYVMDARTGVISAAIPFDALGQHTEILCRRQRSTVPFLLEAIQLALMQEGYIAVHASAFVYQGVGALAMGWTKGGKTESLLAFGNHGAHYVGDEWVVVSGDGTEMFGLPVPITIWDWQFSEIPDLLPEIGRSDRALFAGIRLIGRTSEWLSRGRLRATSPAKRLGMGVPLLERGLRVKALPSDVFGERLVTTKVRPDVLFLMTSRRESRIEVERVDGIAVADSMTHSNVLEHAHLFEMYRAFRFAFPHRRNAILDDYEDRQRQLLRGAFDGKCAHRVLHPYPVSFDGLFEQMQVQCHPPGTDRVTHPGE